MSASVMRQPVSRSNRASKCKRRSWKSLGLGFQFTMQWTWASVSVGKMFCGSFNWWIRGWTHPAPHLCSESLPNAGKR